MKKRFWSLILIVIMAISLVGCGDKKSKASLTGILEKTETMTTGAGSMELSFALDYPEEELAKDPQINDMIKNAVGMLKDGVFIKLEFVVESMDKVQTTILYKMKKDDSYKKLTDVILCDKEMYIDIKSIKDAVVSFVPEFSVYASAITIEKDYIKFSEADMKQLSSMAGAQAGNAFSFSMGELKEQQEVSIILSKILASYFEDAVNGVKPEVITGDEDSVTVSLNKENLAAVLEALEATDITSCIDEFVKEAEKMDKMKDMVEEIKAEKETAVKEYKEALKEFKDDVKDINDADYELKYTVGVTGDEGSRKQTVSLKAKAEDDECKMELVVEANTEEKTDKKVTAPSSSIGYMEFFQSLGAGLGNN